MILSDRGGTWKIWQQFDQKQINKQQTNRYEKYYRQIGLNIAYYRKLRGMSQMALAEATDLSRTHISNIEAPNMKTSLSLESLFDIAGVLQVAPRAFARFPWWETAGFSWINHDRARRFMNFLKHDILGFQR